MRTQDQFAPDLLVRLDRNGIPLRDQLERELREGIRSGRLRPGTELPSTRALAGELGVSRGVVVEAYAQLVAEGWLATRQGSRTRVAPSARRAERAEPQAAREWRARFDFRPGIPDLSAFPRGEWLASARRALRDMPDGALAYGDPRGSAELRQQLAAYVGRARGVVADPERIVVCGGVTNGIALVCSALRRGGARRMAVEDPGFFVHRGTVEHAGLETVPVPVDDDGLDVGRLPDDVDAVLCTPTHQSPIGAVLSPERRTALLAWAERRDALILEDDYDAEYRYDREPVGALQGLAPERVVFLGSASKSLAPALRLGWLVAPDRLRGALAAEKWSMDLGAGLLDQLTLADLIARGELDRHLRRTRRLYRRRRDALVMALDRHLPEARVYGVAAGLHALVRLPDEVDEARLTAECVARGIAFGPMAAHRIVRSDSDWPGIVLGYANVPEPSIERGVEELAAAVAAVRS